MRLARLPPEPPTDPLQGCGLWNMLFTGCDEYTSTQVINRLLIWMPAHKSASAIGQFFKSDGSSISAIDWRANRLADCLARLAANIHSVTDSAINLHKGAQQAAEFCAAWLGTVTHASNNHKVAVNRPNGLAIVSTCRDSAPGKRASKFRVIPDEQTPNTANPDMIASEGRGAKRGIQLVDSPSMHTSVPPALRLDFPVAVSIRSPAAATACKNRAAERAHDTRCNESFWKYWHENRASCPPPTAPAVSGAQRLEALRRRLHQAT
jgi:hypothetical protein